MSDEENKVVPMSRTRAKRLFNFQNTQIAERHSANRRIIENLFDDLTLERRKLANASAVLEAVVRRHGPQVFDRKAIEGLCARGQIQFDVYPDRIVVRLDEKPENAPEGESADPDTAG